MIDQIAQLYAEFAGTPPGDRARLDAQKKRPSRRHPSLRAARRLSRVGRRKPHPADTIATGYKTDVADTIARQSPAPTMMDEAAGGRATKIV